MSLCSTPIIMHLARHFDAPALIKEVMAQKIWGKIRGVFPWFLVLFDLKGNPQCIIEVK